MTQASRLFRQAFIVALIIALVTACGGVPGPDNGNGDDTTPPDITSFTSSSTTVTAAGDITLTAEASDNEGVTKVEFFRQGADTPIATDTEANAEGEFEAIVNLTAEDNGTVVFVAKAYDAAGNTDQTDESNSVTVTVNIAVDTPGNDPPTATDATVRTETDTAIDITLAAEDPDEGDTLTFEVLADTLLPADAGTLSELDPATNTVTFTPASGFEDTATFEFTVTDAEGESDTGTVTVVVGDFNVVYVDGDDATADTEANAGSQENPFNTLQAAQDASAPGDIIFVFATTEPYTSGISLQSGQQLIGEAAGLTVGGTELVPAGERPVIEPDDNGPSSGRGVMMDGIEGATIRGLEIRNSWDSAIEGFGVSGVITIENVILTSPGSVDEAAGAEPNTNTAGNSGIFILHSADPAIEDSITIRDVQITDPARFGIWLNDPNDVVIADNPDLTAITGVTISGVNDPSALTAGAGFGGVGVSLESEFAANFSLSDLVVESDASNVDGIDITKNGTTGDADMTVSVNGTTVTFADAATGTVGFRVANFEDGPDGGDDVPGDTDQYDASGAMVLSGDGNTVTTADQVFVVNGQPGSGASGEITGSITIDGTAYPGAGPLSIQAMPASRIR